jgi:histidinol-phosphatase (PHP family)
MINFNFHQHSVFSDGKAEPEKYVEQALDLGFIALGFSEHSPLPFDTPFSLKQENIRQYVSEIDRLKDLHAGKINIYRSLEIDFIPGYSENFEEAKKSCQTEYAIGGVHLVIPDNPGDGDIWFIDGPDSDVYDRGISDYFDGNIKKAVKTYFRQLNTMIDTQDFDVVAHFDKIKMHNRNRFFTEDEKWYRELVGETLSLIKQKGLIAEVNTRGLYKKRSDSLFPDGKTLQQLIEHGIPVIISSDAHKPDELNLFFDHAIEKLLAFGRKYVMYFNGTVWEEKALV